MEASPDLTSIMTGRPLKHHADLPHLEEESVGDCAACYPELSLNENDVLDRLLVLLSSYLQPQPSRISLFPPRFLLSICDALQPGRLDNTREQNDASAVLPSVLSKLRDWRLHDLEYRFSPGGIHKLALDLVGIISEYSAVSSLGINQPSHGRLRVRWARSDSPRQNHYRELFPCTPSPPSTPIMDSAQKCLYNPPDNLGERRFDATHASCQTRDTPDSEDATAVVLRRHSGPGFRSGCSACRHPRDSDPSAPSSPHMTSFEQRTSLFDTVIPTCVASSRHRKSSIGLHNMTKNIKHEQRTSLHSIAHDENEPPLPKLVGASQGTGMSFPRQHTHSSRISNTLSCEPCSSVQRRLELNRLLNPPRESDKRTSSHRAASVDLRLPITGTNHLLHSPNHASPIDSHTHASTPTRVQNFSHSQVNSRTLGSVAARVPPQSSNQNLIGSRSGMGLPSWSSSRLGRHQGSTAIVAAISSVKVKPLAMGSVVPTPSKAKTTSVHTLLPIQSTRSRLSSLSILPKVPSYMGMKPCDLRTVPSQTYKHLRSDGALPSSPLPTRKWRVSNFASVR